MTTTAITIRKLPEDAKQRLRLRAAAHGQSMEAEAREILLTALDESLQPDISWIEQLIAAGIEYGDLRLPALPDSPASPADFGA